MRIINDILDLSKLRSGKFVIEKKLSNIPEICHHIKNLFLAISKAKNIDLVLDIAKDVPTFLVIDAVRIKQLLTNLVGNALKFSNKGTVTLKLSLKNSSQDNVTLKFEIIDCGKGIAKDKVATIFNAYQQLRPDDTDKSVQGTGLGLHICKSLVELMDGEIGVKSELKKGSNFWFTIRANKVPNKLHKINTEIQKEENFKKLDLHVLLVDDNKTLCTVYKRMLDAIGCQTVVAHDGEEVISFFKESVYDIVLLDINMPIMDGLETMRYLRGNFNNLPPIICATASALKGDIDRYIEEGFDDYITKPFKMSSLYSKLSKWEPYIKPNTPKIN